MRVTLLVLTTTTYSIVHFVVLDNNFDHLDTIYFNK